MKNIKTYENYIDEKINALKKLKEIIDFIEKYNLKYFVIAMEMEDDNYMFEDIRKENGVYKLEYGDGVNNKVVNLIDLSTDVINSLYQCCKEYRRFDIEFHLETGFGDIEEYINVFKIHKKKIKFNQWMFSMFIENDMQDDANLFEFQDILFSTHPEAYREFINECFDITADYEPLKVHPKILKKYKKLLGEYHHQKVVEYESEKYNL